MERLIECVPNFSEGREQRKLERIIQALLAGPEVYLLDKEMDADHNRSVITLAGTPEGVGQAALRGIGRATELIDLNRHQGAHPRIGATDVVPFVPIAGVTLDECIRVAVWVAEQAWLRFRVPTYLYEAAARRPDRRNLENIRRGQFEGLREEVRTNPERLPDFGEAALHPTAGATVVGARKFLIAYNVNLNTPDVGIAKTIAKKIRTSGGGFPCVKAMGVELKARNLAQVSMNLTDFETTPIATVLDAVNKAAAERGVSIAGSEIVGLIPRKALEDAAVDYLKVENYRPDLILENRLSSVMEMQSPRDKGQSPQELSRPGGPIHQLASGFVDAVAADAPTPGGGSVSALAAALGAALGEKVAKLTLRKKAYAEHHAAIEDQLRRLSEVRARLMEAVDRDAASYEAVIAAYRLPKATASEQDARAKAIQEATKNAALVPLQTAAWAKEVAELLQALKPITVPQAASDIAVGISLAAAAKEGAMENVRANLASITDSELVAEINDKLNRL